MTFRIQDIKSALEGGGARPSLFQIELTFPAGLDIFGASDARAVTSKLSLLCKAASIPASTIPEIEVPYKGRKIKVAGNRTFEPWTITIINDEDFLIRNAFENWMQAINGHSSNLRGLGASSNPADYKAEGHVLQFAKDADTLPLRKYKFEGLWPSETSSIDLSWEAENTIEEFTVTMQYDLWELDTSE